MPESIQALPAVIAAPPADGPLGIYVHVPYCASRCGYCDFNTYTAAELGSGVRQDTYRSDVIAEIDLVARRWRPDRPLQTVFFGGGTPTLLPAGDLVAILGHLAATFGLAPDVEVTTEANPDSVDETYLRDLRQGGFTRLSLGMQSASSRVLAVLDRSHTPGRAAAAVAQARAAGFDRVSLDLIYGTPGESDQDWADSLAAVVAAGVDHVSAYALTVEPGTAMGAAVRRGTLARPDLDVAARRYEYADDLLSAAGFRWYEISNWATPGQACRHNLGYWDVRGQWWGLGPGAHSHVDGVRLMNVKHPRTYASLLSAGQLPLADYEELTPAERQLESVMLAVRLSTGVTAEQCHADAAVFDELVAEGLMARKADAFALTRRGRLLADAVTLRLTAGDPTRG